MSPSARLAQSVEHETLNLGVVGSSPTLGVQFCLLKEFFKDIMHMADFLFKRHYGPKTSYYASFIKLFKSLVNVQNENVFIFK